jgi:multidrug efflux pump subunit AcrA (membrane-fusion protein)
MRLLNNSGWGTIVSACLVLLLGAARLWADDEGGGDAQADPTKAAATKEKEKEKPKEPGATHTVARGPLKLDAELDGTFISGQTSEIVLRPELWADLTVQKAVPHGSRVKAGELLVQLETKKVDEAIADAEAERQLDELAAKQAAEDLRLSEQSTPLDLLAAERAATIAKEDLQHFLHTDRPLAEKGAEFSLKNAASMLENATEELRQLEKMYKADDLTEETEEIILKRTRHEVEQAKFMFENAKNNHQETLKISLPRRQETMERAARTTSLDLEKARATLPITLNQKRLALAKAQQELSKVNDKLAKLKQDRAMLSINSPTAGAVYYGRWVDGKWTGGAESAEMLKTGGKIVPGQVILTVINPDLLHVRASAAEKQLHALKAGQTVRVVPTGYPEAKLPAKIVSVSPIPSPSGGYEVRIVRDAGPQSVPLAAGMTAKAHVLLYSNDQAIAVPSGAVFTDEWSDAGPYVYVVDKEGKPQRRNVEVGRKSDEKTEIVRGLEVGEKILLAKPEKE